MQIRRLPKPVIAMVYSSCSYSAFLFLLHLFTCSSLYISTLFQNQVAGYAVGGGHVLHMVCDLTIAADNAIFGQTGPKVLNVSILFCCLFVILKLIVSTPSTGMLELTKPEMVVQKGLSYFDSPYSWLFLICTYSAGWKL